MVSAGKRRRSRSPDPAAVSQQPQAHPAVKTPHRGLMLQQHVQPGRRAAGVAADGVQQIGLGGAQVGGDEGAVLGGEGGPLQAVGDCRRQMGAQQADRLGGFAEHGAEQVVVRLRRQVVASHASDRFPAARRAQPAPCRGRSLVQAAAAVAGVPPARAEKGGGRRGAGEPKVEQIVVGYWSVQPGGDYWRGAARSVPLAESRLKAR